MNLALLDDALALIDANPGAWKQDSWGACVAGKIADVTGVEWRTKSLPLGYTYVIAYVNNENGDSEHVMDYARRMLGIEPWQAAVLFHSGNTRAHLQVIRDALAWGGCTIDDDMPVHIGEVLVTSVAG